MKYTIFIVAIFFLTFQAGHATSLEDCETAISDNTVQQKIFDELESRQRSGLLFSMCAGAFCKNSPLSMQLMHSGKKLNLLIYPDQKHSSDNHYFLKLGIAKSSKVPGVVRDRVIYLIQNIHKHIYFNGVLTGTLIVQCEFGEYQFEQMVPSFQMSSGLYDAT